MNPHKFHSWTKLSGHNEITIRWFLFDAICPYSGYMFYGSPISTVKFNPPNSVLNYTKFISFSQLVNIPIVPTLCVQPCAGPWRFSSESNRHGQIQQPARETAVGPIPQTCSCHWGDTWYLLELLTLLWSSGRTSLKKYLLSWVGKS